MGIRFVCDSCDRKLHVKAFLAGKLGLCPHCNARVRIPQEQAAQSAGPVAQIPGNGDAASGDVPREADVALPIQADRSSASGSKGHETAAAPPSLPLSTAPSAPVATDPISDAPAATWYVRPPSGGQFGPASGEVMRSWIDEGRVTADSLVWREGWEDWVTAESEFASLQTRPLIKANGPAWDPVPSDGPETGSGAASSRGRRSSRNETSRSSASAIFVTLLLITVVLLGILVFVLSR